MVKLNMRLLLFTFSILALFPCESRAQNQDLDIVSDPICFLVRNTADFTMYGNIVTAEYTRPDGVKARHRSNFKLGAAGSFDHDGYPDDRAEFCSYGPFFTGRKLEISIRTLFPVDACQTRLDQGEILLKATRKADDSGYDYKVSCFE